MTENDREILDEVKSRVSLTAAKAYDAALAGDVEEAADRWREEYEQVLKCQPVDENRLQLARDNLAGQLRNLGRHAEATALYATTDVCEHLQSAKQAILDAGGKIYYVGTPWSRNCRNWMYFEGVWIDALALRERLKLDHCVVVHSHRGTHDGHEQGLVCEIHHDAVMGPHPDLASASLKVVS